MELVDLIFMLHQLHVACSHTVVGSSNVVDEQTVHLVQSLSMSSTSWDAL